MSTVSTSALMAESLAATEAVKWATQTGLKKVILEGDSQDVMDFMEGKIGKMKLQNRENSRKDRITECLQVGTLKLKLAGVRANGIQTEAFLSLK